MKFKKRYWDIDYIEIDIEIEILRYIDIEIDKIRRDIEILI